MVAVAGGELVNVDVRGAIAEELQPGDVEAAVGVGAQAQRATVQLHDRTLDGIGVTQRQGAGIEG